MRYSIAIMFLLNTFVIQAQTTPHQCEGLTVKKVQCKNKAVEGSTYCGIHNPSVPRCGTQTTKKQPCKNRVPKTGDKCFRHQQR